jgi:hypothetical protein
MVVEVHILAKGDSFSVVLRRVIRKLLLKAFESHQPRMKLYYCKITVV